MGRLRDIINGMSSRNPTDNVKFTLNAEELQKPSPVEIEAKENSVGGYYNRGWASRVALFRGYALNDDDRKVDGILAALNRRDGHCPCGGSGPQFKCPCTIMQDSGICKCGLFKTIGDRQIRGTHATGKIIKNDD